MLHQACLIDEHPFDQGSKILDQHPEAKPLAKHWQALVRSKLASIFGTASWRAGTVAIATVAAQISNAGDALQKRNWIQCRSSRAQAASQTPEHDSAKDLGWGGRIRLAPAGSCPSNINSASLQKRCHPCVQTSPTPWYVGKHSHECWHPGTCTPY